MGEAGVVTSLGQAHRALRAELGRRSLSAFLRAGWHVLEPTTPLVWGPHIEALCGAVQGLIEDWACRQRDPSFVQRARDLLCTVPPGSLKSRVLTYSIPFAWLRWPSLRVISLSTNPRVSLRDSMLAREVIGSSWYQSTFRPTWTVRQDSDAKGLFSNSAGGWRAAMGFDSRIVGERADLLAVDDPHDPEEALSDAQRRAVLERWDSAIANRVNDLGSSIRLCICQRVHEDDFAAARIREGWCHLNLPMEYEASQRCESTLGSDWRTVEGESLHPERFTPEVIAKEKQRCGPLRWAALYQQRPTPAGGSIVKLEWLRYWRAEHLPDAQAARPRGAWQGPSAVLPKAFETVTIAADLGMGKKTATGDFSVVLAIGKYRSSFYVMDVWRQRADFPDIVRAFKALSEKWPGARKCVEAAAAGRALETSLRAEVPGLIGIPPMGSKIQRLHAVLAFWEAGNVHLDEHDPQLHELVSELITFPNARHDDFVDAVSLGLGQALGRPSDAPGWSTSGDASTVIERIAHNDNDPDALILRALGITA